MIEFSCLYWSFMEYLLLSLLIVIAIVSYLNHRRDRKLLCSLFLLPQEGQEQSGNSVSRCEEGVYPKAIFHDLYVKKKNGVRNGENPVVVASHVVDVQNRN